MSSMLATFLKATFRPTPGALPRSGPASRGPSAPGPQLSDRGRGWGRDGSWSVSPMELVRGLATCQSVLHLPAGWGGEPGQLTACLLCPWVSPEGRECSAAQRGLGA